MQMHCTLNSREKRKKNIDAEDKGRKKKLKIARHFGILSSTVLSILKNKEVILRNLTAHQENRRKMKSRDYPG